MEWSAVREDKCARNTTLFFFLMQIGEKSLFTKELENALERNEWVSRCSTGWFSPLSQPLALILELKRSSLKDVFDVKASDVV